MGAAFLAVSAKFPEVLGELPFFSDQTDLSNHNSMASPECLGSEEEGFPVPVRQNDQILWATRGAWDLYRSAGTGGYFLASRFFWQSG